MIESQTCEGVWSRSYVGLGSLESVEISGPIGVPLVEFDERSEAEAVLASDASPAHTAAAEADIDQRFSGRFDGTAADR